ncbi:MAG: WG repeat-containing protein, partial [Bacteroidetes bacterium]|nr:WG repeat-containing protein [Bacteroidota bacterium]
LINRRGEFLIQPKYDDLSLPSQEVCVAVSEDHSAYLLKNGKPLTGFLFDIANDFKNGVAIVSVNEKFGLLNTAGKYAIDPAYEELVLIAPALLKANKNGKWGILDFHGQIILPFEYDAIGEFSQHLTLVAQNGKCGYVNEKGLIVIPVKYNYTSALLTTGTFTNGFVSLKLKAKRQLIDTTGSALPLTAFDDFRLPGSGLIPVKKNKKWGYAAMNGKIAIPCKYESAETFVGGLE